MFRKHSAKEKPVTVSADDPKYCKELINSVKKDFKKVKGAIQIVDEIKKIKKLGEDAIPQEIIDIINKTIKIARQSS